MVGDDVLTARAGDRRRDRQRRGDAADRRPRHGAAPGTTATRRPRSGSRRAWSSSAAARSAPSWRRPGRRSGSEVTLVEGRRAAAAARGALRRRTGRRPRCASAYGVDVQDRDHGRAASPQPATGIEVELDDGSPVDGGRGPGRGRPQAAHRRRSGWTRSASRPTSGASSRPTSSLRVGGRDWLYAVGDVNGRALFTHMGKYQAWVAAENVLGRAVEAIAEGHRLAPGHLHRPAGRGGRQDPGSRRRRRASTPVRSTSPPTAPPAPASRARARAAPPASSSMRRHGTVVGATFTGFETADFLHAATDRGRRRGAAARACATRSPPTRPAARCG